MSHSISVGTKDDTAPVEPSKEDDSQVVVFMSCRENETSIQSGELGQGVFTYFLLKGMNGSADKNMDKVVTIEELFYYVRDSTYSYTRKNWNHSQCPIMYGKFDKNLIISTF